MTNQPELKAIEIFENGFQGHPHVEAGAFGEGGTDPNTDICCFEFSPEQVKKIIANLSPKWQEVRSILKKIELVRHSCPTNTHSRVLLDYVEKLAREAIALLPPPLAEGD